MNQAHPIIKRWKNLVEKGERPGGSWYKGEKEDAGKKKHLGCYFILDIEGMRKKQNLLGCNFFCRYWWDEKKQELLGCHFIDIGVVNKRQRHLVNVGLAPCLTLHYNLRNKVRQLPSGHTWDVKCPIKVWCLGKLKRRRRQGFLSNSIRVVWCLWIGRRQRYLF